MRVHPGCPVCSIVAVSLVAVETDVGETISAAKVAFVCGLWSVRVVALLSAGNNSNRPQTTHKCELQNDTMERKTETPCGFGTHRTDCTV